MTLPIKDGRNQDANIKTAVPGGEHVAYHNELADFYLRLARGDVTGAVAYRIHGANPAVTNGGAAASEDVWDFGGRMTWPTAATALLVSSTSANDTSAGTGARTVTITGLSAAWAEVSETVTMSGTSKVATTQTFLRVNSVDVATQGATGHNEGTILVEHGSASPYTPIAQIPIARLHGMSTHFSVASGKVGFIRDWYGVGPDGARIRYDLLAGNQDSNGALKMLDSISAYIAQVDHDLPLFSTPIPAQSDIVVRADRLDGAGAKDTAAGYSLVVVDSSEILA